VAPGQAAAAAGLVAGDRIISIGGQPVAGGQAAVADLVSRIKASPDHTLQLEAESNGRRRSLSLTPADVDGIGKIGAQLQPFGNQAYRPAKSPLEVIRPQLELLKASDNLVWTQASGGRLPPAMVARLEAHLQALAGLAAGCRPERPGDWRRLLVERDRLLVLTPRRRGPWGGEGIHRTKPVAGSTTAPAGPVTSSKVSD
jgi:hypothetical protein